MKHDWKRGSTAGPAVVTLLSRLEEVRRTGVDRWMARCPCHDDKNPSLSVRETPDGRILINDWGGCGTDAVLRTLGLNLTALFPDRLPDGLHRTDKAPRIPASDILRVVANEVYVAACAASELEAGRTLSLEDRDRLSLCVRRLNEASEAANG